MGTSAILYTGLRALLAQQTAIHVAGQNIANVNTPGYSRQRVHLVADQIPQRGALLTAGVSVAEITRVVDRFLTAQLTATSAAAASTQAQADFLNHIEALFNELPLEDAGLAGLLDRFFQAFHDLAARPQGLPERTVVREQGQALAEAFQQLAQGLADTQRALTTAIAAEVTQINRLAGRLAELNLEIQRVEVDPTQHANTLRDERDQVLRQLAERVQVTAFETAGGLTVLLGGGRPLVEGTRASTLVTQADADDPQQVYVLLQDPQGHQVAVDDRILGGRLHGLLQLKAGFVPEVAASLDRLAAQLNSAVNALHRSGYGLDGSTEVPFFVPRQVHTQALAANEGGARIESASVVDPAQLTLDTYHLVFTADGPPPQFDVVNATTGETVLSGQTYVSGATVAFDGLALVLADSGQPPRRGDTFVIDTTRGAAQAMAVNPEVVADVRKIAAAQTPEAGDNANALAIAALAEAELLDGETLGAFYAALLSRVGAEKQHTDSLAEQQQLLLTELETRRETVSGVSLDEEQVDLLRFQQAYSAAAQLIAIADDMTRTVMDLLR